MTIGAIILYTAGLLYFAWQTENTIAHSFTVTILPFIWLEVVKIAGAATLAYSINVSLKRRV